MSIHHPHLNGFNGDSYDTVNVIGYPGAGKGTLFKGIEMLNLRLQILGVGDLVRSHFKNRTPRGMEAIQYAQSGQLVPDSLIKDMIADEVTNFDPNQIWGIDGFPRKDTQVEPYIQLMQETGRKDLSVYLALGESPEESGRIARERLQARLEWCKANGEPVRPDDSDPKAVEKRMKEAQHLYPALNKMKEAGKPIVTIEAWRPFEEVRAQIQEIILPALCLNKAKNATN